VVPESNVPEPDPAVTSSTPPPTPSTPTQGVPVTPPPSTAPGATPYAHQAPAPGPYPVPPRATFTGAPVGWTIAAMLTFWPTGIPALLASHRAARAFGAADHETAQRESANARRWGIVSVCVAAGLLVINVLLLLAWFAFVALAVHEVRDDGWRDGRGWSVGPQLDGQGPDGRQLDGPRLDGPGLDGPRPDGRQLDGRRGGSEQDGVPGR